jgi:hypothetical protein
MKRLFGLVEVIFDVLYLTTALIIGFILIFSASGNSVRMLAGIMALVLAGGDAFHLVPRIIVILTGKKDQLREMLGRGKQITSITMTLFYVFLWQIGINTFSPKSMILWSYLIYALAIIRVFLCLLPQNKWTDYNPHNNWAIWRNIPFFLQGMLVAGFFFIFRNTIQEFNMMWLAIVLSFAFYIPVVLWVDDNPKIGMLMLPKTLTYLWMLFMCLSL